MTIFRYLPLKWQLQLFCYFIVLRNSDDGLEVLADAVLRKGVAP